MQYKDFIIIIIIITYITPTIMPTLGLQVSLALWDKLI